MAKKNPLPNPDRHLMTTQNPPPVAIGVVPPSPFFEVSLPIHCRLQNSSASEPHTYLLRILRVIPYKHKWVIFNERWGPLFRDA